MVVPIEVEAASGCIGARMPPEAGDAARWPGDDNWCPVTGPVCVVEFIRRCPGKNSASRA